MSRTYFPTVLLCISLIIGSPCILHAANEASAGAPAWNPDADPDTRGFYDIARNYTGWTGNFYEKYADCLSDYYRSTAAGGQENSWIDTSDMHYHVSHGGNRWDAGYGKNLKSILFEDAGYVCPSEAQNSWGNLDLEWIAFRNCSLLNDESRKYWAQTMDGLHLFLGFKTNSGVYDNFGKYWAEAMRRKTYTFWPGISFTIPALSITQAWFYVTDETQGNGTVARVLAETADCFNDYARGQGPVLTSDPERDGLYWYWDHEVGAPAIAPTTGLRTMILQIVSFVEIDEAYVSMLASAYGLSDERIAESRDFYFVTDGVKDPNLIMQVHKRSGQYFYMNAAKLWAEPRNAQFFPPEEATNRVVGLLQEKKLFPPDVGVSETHTDQLVQEDKDGRRASVIQKNTSVVFSREVLAREDAPVTVVGPGARMRVYLDEKGEIIGAKGNWRPVERQEEVPVMSEEEAWSIFKDFDKKYSLNPILADYEAWSQNPEYKARQGYYEYGADKRQQLLIPVWIFEVEFWKDDQLVERALQYLPANKELSPPIVEIVEPENGATIDPGKPVAFKSRLTEGFGSPPFRYIWQSDADGVLSTDPEFATDKLNPKCPAISCDCHPIPHVITLTVTDRNGFSASDSIALTVDSECKDCTDCGDLNHDGIVDFIDFSIGARKWQTRRQGDE